MEWDIVRADKSAATENWGRLYKCIISQDGCPDSFVKGLFYTRLEVSGYFLLDRSFHWDSKRAHSEHYRQAHRLSLLAAFDVLDA